MAPDEVEEVRFALSRPRFNDWMMPPVTPGDWQELEGEEALATVLSVCRWISMNTGEPNLAQEWSIDRVRVRPLACYEDALLVEFAGYADHSRPGLINVILIDEEMVLLDGNSSAFHELNMTWRPKLQTPAGRLDYLLLFMNWVHGDEGRFHPIGSPEELAARLDPEAGFRIDPAMLAPMRELPPPEDATDGTAQFSGTVLYGDALFVTNMHVYPNGMVEMMDDEPLMAPIPVRPEQLVGPLLVTPV
ncbi:hypothetical protein [Hyphomonas sp.]|uniref:hypothetical protein n=1 Tax=Hyphomonas sp. TaxID=87 RepID=UPI00391B219B